MPDRSFLRHAAAYALGTLVVSAGSFFLLPIYTRCLSPADFGALEILNRTAEVLVICLLFGGIRQAALAFHGQSEDAQERRQVIATLLVLLATILAVGALAIAVVDSVLPRFLKVPDDGLLPLALAAAMAEGAMLVLLALPQARQQSALYVAVTVSQFLVRCGAVIVLVVAFGWGVRGILVPSAVVPGLVAVGLALNEAARGAVGVSAAKFRSMLVFALPFLPSGVGFFVLNNGDRFFLLRCDGDVAVGVYALGYKLALAVGLFARTPFALVWSARMYEAARRPDAAAVFGTVFSRFVGAYLAVGLALCLFAPEVIALVAGARYASAADVVPLVVLAYLFLAMADLMESGLYVRRRTVHKTWIVVISTSIMFGLYALLIPRWGARGAALATLGGFAGHAALTGLVSQRVFPVRYERVRVLVMTGLALALWFVGHLLPVGGWTVPTKVVLWASWFGTLWAFGLVSPEEKQWVAVVPGLGRGLLKLRSLRVGIGA